MSTRSKHGHCPLCRRLTHLTFHHFVPRKVHRRAHFKKHFTKDQLNQGVALCRQCHSGIHRFYDEMHIAKHLSTLDSLRADPPLRTHFDWVSRQRVK